MIYEDIQKAKKEASQLLQYGAYKKSMNLFKSIYDLCVQVDKCSTVHFDYLKRTEKFSITGIALCASHLGNRRLALNQYRKLLRLEKDPELIKDIKERIIEILQNSKI